MRGWPSWLGRDDRLFRRPGLDATLPARLAHYPDFADDPPFLYPASTSDAVKLKRLAQDKPVGLC